MRSATGSLHATREVRARLPAKRCTVIRRTPDAIASRVNHARPVTPASNERLIRTVNSCNFLTEGRGRTPYCDEGAGLIRFINGIAFIPPDAAPRSLPSGE